MGWGMVGRIGGLEDLVFVAIVASLHEHLPGRLHVHVAGACS